MIIGFSYKAQSGKDTSVDYLVKTYSFLKDSFAFSLKQSCKIVFGLSDEQLEYTKEIEDPFWHMTPRRIMQLAGTEGGRDIFGEDLWIKTLERRVMANSTRNYGISDVRYLNEVKAIKSWGGILVRIDRDGSGTESKHRSEKELDSFTKWDEIIDNNGDFNHLYSQLDRIVSRHILAEKPKKTRKRKTTVVGH